MITERNEEASSTGGGGPQFEPLGSGSPGYATASDAMLADDDPGMAPLQPSGRGKAKKSHFTAAKGHGKGTPTPSHTYTKLSEYQHVVEKQVEEVEQPIPHKPVQEVVNCDVLDKKHVEDAEMQVRSIKVVSERHKGGRFVRWNKDLPGNLFGDKLRRVLTGHLPAGAHIDNACLRHSNGDAVDIGDLHEGRLTGNVFLVVREEDDGDTDIVEVD